MVAPSPISPNCTNRLASSRWVAGAVAGRDGETCWALDGSGKGRR
jgi:hypothetical protein